MRHTHLGDGSRPRLLHVAPEPILRRLLRERSALHVGVDLMRDQIDVCCRLEALPWPDGAFDVVLCSHVLEHVTDDRLAMRELRRVLADTGWAILQSPIDFSLGTTLEDPSATDPRERERLFGQRDHVRLYGRDYPARLRQEGFTVTIVPFTGWITTEDASRCALVEEDLFVCATGRAAPLGLRLP